MKKLGFTLIELLAVILILGIIALIAIPTVNTIIIEAKKGAFKTSVQNILKGVEEQCRIEQMNGQNITDTYTFNENGVTPNLDVKGSLPTSESMIVSNECDVILTNITDGNYIVSKNLNNDQIDIRKKTEEDITLVNAIKRDNTVGIPLTLPITGISSATDKLFLKSEDDDGDTYYFRGNVDNNYVKFGTYRQDVYVYTKTIDGYLWEYYFDTQELCDANYAENNGTTSCQKVKEKDEPMVWRIVRINGDGTVRMVLTDNIGTLKYNEIDGNEKYMGYTYDRTTNETNSTIKTYVDNWYNKNIGNHFNTDALVATTKYCSDTSNRDETNLVHFGFDSRMQNDDYPFTINATFKCATTNETFGGLYNLKVGLLTADELVYAGMNFHYYAGNNDNENQYLWNGTEYWTMTPYFYTSASKSVDIITGSKSISGMYLDRGINTRPVINLIKNALITSGNGTTSNPYVINVN